MEGCSADRNPLAARFQVDQRDWCQKEFQENDVQTANKNREIKELSSLIETSALVGSARAAAVEGKGGLLMPGLPS